MADPAQKLHDDRALRDAARALVQGDISFVRESMSARSIPARLAARATGGARDIAGEAAAVAEENRKAIGAGLVLGAVSLAGWLLREPIKQRLGDLFARSGLAGKPGEPDQSPAVSDES